MNSTERRFSLRALAVLGIALATLLLPLGQVRAVQPDEILKDAKLERRAREISAELRCLVCQNQSIDDSNAPLARDLRLLVRERLQKGDSDAQVKQFVVARYGEFALLRPSFGLHTLLLWLTPMLVLGLAGWILYRRTNAPQGAGSTAASLSPEERERLAELLKDAER